MAQAYPKPRARPLPAGLPRPANDNWRGPIRSWPYGRPANDNGTGEPPVPGQRAAKARAKKLLGIALNPANYIAGWIWGNFQGLDPIGYSLAYPGESPFGHGWSLASSCRTYTNYTHVFSAGSIFCGPLGNPSTPEGVNYTITEQPTQYVHRWEFLTYREPNVADPNFGNDPVWRFYRRWFHQFTLPKSNPDAGNPQELPSTVHTPVNPVYGVAALPHPALRPNFRPYPDKVGFEGPAPQPRVRPQPWVNPWPTPDLPPFPRHRPGPTRPSRPPPRTKERKSTLTVTGTPVGWALNVVTESLDVLNCAYKSMPKSKQIPPRWDPSRHGGQGGWRRASPQQIAMHVYANAAHISVANFVRCLMENQVEDYLIGKIGQLTRSANQRSAQFAGFAFGPAL